MIDWTAINAIANVLSMVAFILTAIYVRAELKAMDKDRYLTITNQLFEIWETPEFTNAQLWLIHRLEERTWPDFVKAHRADKGEAAFLRVGSFYDRVGLMVQLGFVRAEEILPTVGAHAVRVWEKIQPLVYEARRVEHSSLFENFEKLLPACFECYVPSTSRTKVRPLPEPAAPRVEPAAVYRRLSEPPPVTVLDVRPAAKVAGEPVTLPNAVLLTLPEVEQRYAELPREREVIAFCT
jgi:hypothetical protein